MDELQAPDENGENGDRTEARPLEKRGAEAPPAEAHLAAEHPDGDEAIEEADAMADDGADSAEDHDPDIDRKTLLWAMAGDDSAFARLIQHYDPSLRTLVFAQVERADLMDRVLASSYLKAYRALPRLKAVGQPGAWLSGIAAKACASELRRESQRAQSRRQSAEPPTGRTAVGVSHRVDPVSRDPDAATPTLRPKPAAPVSSEAGDESDASDEGVTLLVPDAEPGPSGQDSDGAQVGHTVHPSTRADAALAGNDDSAATGIAGDRHGDPDPSDPDTTAGPAADPPLTDASGDTGDDSPATTPAPPDGTGAALPVAPDNTDEVDEVAPGADDEPVDPLVAYAPAATAGAGNRGRPAEAGTIVRDGVRMVVPEHLPGFWNRLGRQLLAEREVPARPAPTAEQIRAARAASALEPATTADRPAKPRKVKPSDPLARLEPPATVGELAQRVKPPERRTFAIARQIISVVAVIAVVAGIAFAAFRIGGSAKPINRDGMTTGKLAGQITSELDNSTTLAAAFTHGEYAPNGQKLEAAYDLTYGSNGSFRLHGTNVQSDLSYDAAAGVRRSRTESPAADGSLNVRQQEAAGLATGPPDPSADIDQFFDGGLAEVLRQMRQQPDLTVESSRFAGRPTWQVNVDLPGGDGTPDEARLQVDKQLTVPVHLVLSAQGKKLREYSLTNVALDQAVQDGSFSVVFSDGPVEQTNDGFTRMPLADVSGALDGYQPATPTFLPAGFELTEVAVHEGRGGRTGPDGSNPPSFNTVSVDYRRGWEQVTVTTRSNTAEQGQQWFDPFATTNPAPPAENVTLNGGRFRMVDAKRVVAPGVTPHLWGVTSDVVFTVSGDLSGDDLVRVAESIR